MKENRNKDMPNYIQMRCPVCGEEFAFPRGRLDAERDSLARKNMELTARLQEIKLIPPGKRTQETAKERAWLIREQGRTLNRIKEIKTIMKQASEPITSDLFQLYREKTAEAYGKGADEKIIEWAKENLQAYHISGLSAHEYTRAGGKIIRKV